MNTLINWKKAIPISLQRHQNPFLSIHNELDKAMSDFYHLIETPSFSRENFEKLVLAPSIDIVDDKENFKVEAEMPGVDENDIKVSIGDHLLTIKAEKTTSKKDTSKNYMLREIGYGSYERNIALPDSVDVSKAKASFKKGMLWINMPKTAETVKLARELPIEKAKE